jgi:hypothetical protein
MDNEFKKVRDHLPGVNLNLPAAGEHIAEIERRIRVVKERCCGIVTTLPYPKMPQLMLIHLIHFVVMFPVPTVICRAGVRENSSSDIVLTTTTTAVPPLAPTVKSTKITIKSGTP